MIRLLVLIQKALGTSPGQRFRLEQWARPLLARHDIALDFCVFESPELTRVMLQTGQHLRKAAYVVRDTFRRREVLDLCGDYDGVVIYREAALLGPAFYERLLHRRGVPIFYEFDDAVWIPVVGSINGVFSRLRFQGKTATLCRLASAVIVGNEYLAAYARQHTSRVFIVPTSIDLARYPVQPPLEKEQPFVVLWSGSLWTLGYLDLCRGPLERLAQKRRVQVKVICNAPPGRSFAGAEMVYVPWRQEGEAEALGQCHVGVMPLSDDVFSRGKCALKALQYMATGRPVVVSPVGVNTDLVRSGDNGLLAGSEDEWVAALSALADSPDLRARLGAAGRRTVEEHYGSERSAARFAQVVYETLGRTDRTSPTAPVPAQRKEGPHASLP